MKKILFFTLITYVFFSYDSYACTTVQTEKKQPNIDELLKFKQPVIYYYNYFFDQDNPIISFDTETVIKELAEYINKNTDHNVYPIDSDLLIAIVRILQKSKQKLKIAHDIDEVCEFLKSKNSNKL